MLLTKSIKVDINKSPLNNCAFSFLLTFGLFFVGFFPVSFDVGDVSNMLVTARVILFL